MVLPGFGLIAVGLGERCMVILLHEWITWLSEQELM
jgi:hypothetical protein